ncbi:MAG: hypothetical protein QOG85_422 [Gaiellaceae bacterium]|jgi:hypothetical protein|nr:hypothetical protein [Gaiellaceae bacterium]
MNRPLIRRLPIALAAIGVLLVMAAAAVGATPTSITLELQGGYNNQEVTKCGSLHHWTMYHLYAKQTMDGTLSPPPGLADGTWRVKIKVKKCVLGAWKVVAQPHVYGNTTTDSNGNKVAVFKWTHKLGARGFFKASAYYYTSSTTSIQSDDVHYHVTY